jgi:hypothetical protein
MNLGRLLNDIHIPAKAKYYAHTHSNHLSFEKKIENDLLLKKKLFASLTQKYWRAYLHSGICIHHQYIHNSPISIIMV